MTVKELRIIARRTRSCHMTGPLQHFLHVLRLTDIDSRVNLTRRRTDRNVVNDLDGYRRMGAISSSLGGFIKPGGDLWNAGDEPEIAGDTESGGVRRNALINVLEYQLSSTLAPGLDAQ